MSEEAKATQLPAWLDTLITRAQDRAKARAAELKAKYPLESPRKLGDRLVKSFSRRAGVGGAITGAIALIALPVGLPAGLAATLFIEAELLFTLLAVYGFDGTGDIGRTRLFTLWAGGGVADAAKNAGLAASANVAAKVIAGSLPARLIGKLHPQLVKLVLRRLGLGWVPRAMKLWPIVGAPLGYFIDSTAVRSLGTSALESLDAALVARREADSAA